MPVMLVQYFAAFKNGNTFSLFPKKNAQKYIFLHG